MNKVVSILLTYLVLTFVTSAAVAAMVTESFTSAASVHEAGGAVWNLGRGELHPPLKVIGWDAGAGAQTSDLDIGDGRHGAFVPARYATFDTDGVISGGVIEINTDVYSDLQFTSIEIAAGYTLRPVGAAPLIMRSQTSIVVNGTIDCSGNAGADAVVGSPVVVRSGGSARCGGGAGGQSVAAGQAPVAANNGTSGGSLVTGGSGGPVQLASGGQGGGGGGAYIKTYVAPPDKPVPTAGDDSLGGVGGAAGTIYRDDSFADDAFGAGSGGGGGSGYNDASISAGHASGAGGGAGGGHIRLYALDGVTVAASGAIYANGGSGGNVPGPGLGGGGGGGGGGSIIIWSFADIVFDGPVTAEAGSAGTSAGGPGGQGAWGRTWVVEKDGFAGGAVVEDPETRLNLPGDTRFETGVTYTVTSQGIDLGNTKPTLTATNTNSADIGGSTITTELAFGDDNALAGLAAFAAPGTYVGEQLQRFVRFKIEFDNTSALTPVRIESIDWQYVGFEQTEFEFITGCGRVGDGSNGGASFGNTSGGVLMLLFLLPLFMLVVLRRAQWLR